jgi:hypothetical protein
METFENSYIFEFFTKKKKKSRKIEILFSKNKNWHFLNFTGERKSLNSILLATVRECEREEFCSVRLENVIYGSWTSA